MTSIFTPPATPASDFEAGWQACMLWKPLDETMSPDWQDGWREADLEASCAVWELQHGAGE